MRIAENCTFYFYNEYFFIYLLIIKFDKKKCVLKFNWNRTGFMFEVESVFWLIEQQRHFSNA